MYNSKQYTVVPAIPEPIAEIHNLAHNLWWTWNYDAVTLFQRLDRRLWEKVRHNPVQLLAALEQKRLQAAASDPAYIAHMDRVLNALKDYMNAKTWFQSTFPDLVDQTMAYFSMEFGLHECLPIYSGGLGILAGDHIKSASDLGVPLVGMGLLYHQGYFQQYLSNDGWQFEDYPDLNIPHLPIKRVRDKNGRPLVVDLPMGKHTIHIQVHKAVVGRTVLYLMDTNIPENSPDDRHLTMRLYGGDQNMRIRQEILLGFGGPKTLRALGHNPSLYHMNEGHCAFLALERIGHLMETEGLEFGQAREAVRGSTVFTTHTPVPAGIDTFPQSLIDQYVVPCTQKLGLSHNDLMSMGQLHRGEQSDPFSMAILALRLARKSNGVSKVHGRVAREMWQHNWPNVPVDEVPISSVTNGIHVRSWLSSDIGRLFERYLGPDWMNNPEDTDVWQGVEDIPDAELWLAHERRRERLVVEARRHLKEQFIRRGATPSEIHEADELLDPEALTIGFARRFAPYKRATLLLRDKERLIKLLTDTNRPVQFVFAGKAHPRDNLGKELIKDIVQFARQRGVRNRLVFLEGYDMGIARFLVQGVDVWMNNPIKPLEASGTSGMKVTPNGGINFSVLDGWWVEGYNRSNGWVIGDDRIYDSADYQDFVESESIYGTLEREIIPMFYERGSDGLPRKWIACMKESMRTCGPAFSAVRMVREYTDGVYVPVIRHGLRLATEKYAAAKSLSEWQTAITNRWSGVAVQSFDAVESGEQRVGASLAVEATVMLGEIKPGEVSVQLYHGTAPSNGTIENGHVVVMECDKPKGKGSYLYRGNIPCELSGQHAYTVRILPKHEDIPGCCDMNLIKWA